MGGTKTRVDPGLYLCSGIGKDDYLPRLGAAILPFASPCSGRRVSNPMTRGPSTLPEIRTARQRSGRTQVCIMGLYQKSFLYHRLLVARSYG